MVRRKTTERVNFSPDRKQNILDKCGGVCLHCGRKIKVHDTFTVEHFIPLNKGGTNDFKNTVALCRECNREKGNAIMSVSFYPYAPKLVKQELDEIFIEYCCEHDWLTQTNFFVYDRFDVPVEEIIHTKGKVFGCRKNAKIEKITNEEAVRFFERYKETLTEKDRMEVPSSEVEIEDGMYRMEYKGKTVGYFGTYLGKKTISTDFEKNYTQMCAFIKMYISPDIKWIMASKQILADIIIGIVWHLTKSIECGNTKAALGIYVVSYMSDRRGRDAFDYICQINDRFDRLSLYDHETENSCNALTANLAVGIDANQIRIESFEDFAKVSKLYSRQLESRMKKNSKGA